MRITCAFWAMAGVANPLAAAAPVARKSLRFIVAPLPKTVWVKRFLQKSG
jgi:hypothetical protein